METLLATGIPMDILELQAEILVLKTSATD